MEADSEDSQCGTQAQLQLGILNQVEQQFFFKSILEIPFDDKVLSKKVVWGILEDWEDAELPRSTSDFLLLLQAQLGIIQDVLTE